MNTEKNIQSVKETVQKIVTVKCKAISGGPCRLCHSFKRRCLVSVSTKGCSKG